MMELLAMSMNFSEFKRFLGADPRSGDPEIQHARHSSPEFEQAAAEADLFEKKLDRAVAVPVPVGLIENILAISQQPATQPAGRKWLPMALAASVLIAVGAAGLTWNMNRGWDSVEEYVMEHYRHDGDKFINLAEAGSDTDIQAVLAELNVEASPQLAEIVGLIKYCPTPDGKGVHMILNTQDGPVTVIYMPDTPVIDRELLAFDGMEAILVDLKKGSAAIIGPDAELVSSLYATVQGSILPLPGSS
jgi:hypothetical protein